MIGPDEPTMLALATVTGRILEGAAFGALLAVLVACIYLLGPFL